MKWFWQKNKQIRIDPYIHLDFLQIMQFPVGIINPVLEYIDHMWGKKLGENQEEVI